MLPSVRGGRSRFVLFLAVVTSLSLLTLDFRGFGPLEKAQDALRTGLEPVAGAIHGAFGPVRNAWHGIVDYPDLRDENDRLRAEVAELRSDPLRAENAQRQLDILMAQLDIDTAANIERRVARVVSGPVSNFENNIRIDKGRSSGIEDDMVVITEAGLVGRVVEATATRSVVEIADSRDFGIGVRLAGAQVPATFTLRGQGRGEPLKVQGEIDPALLHEGDTLVTSGLDQSIFPPDIVVGRVAAIRPDPAGPDRPLRDVEVELAVDPGQLAFVTVLLWQPDP